MIIEIAKTTFVIITISELSYPLLLHRYDNEIRFVFGKSCRALVYVGTVFSGVQLVVNVRTNTYVRM